MTSATPEPQPRLATLAHVIVRHRRAVIVTWVVLTLFGAFSAGQVSKRWFESFSIPGYSAYEANQRTLKTFGTGEQAPLVAANRARPRLAQAAWRAQLVPARRPSAGRPAGQSVQAPRERRRRRRARMWLSR
jgi:hypothetical protein